MRLDFSIKDAPLSGVMLIDASAGTGKTYTISSLVLRLLLEKGLEIDEILVVTYTEAAVDDLKTRVRQKIIDGVAAFNNGASDDGFLGELLVEVPNHPQALRRLTIALRNFDEASIFTIHGFCRRVLNEHSLESGVLFDSELHTDQHDLLQEITEDFFRLNFYGASSLVASYCLKDFAPSNLMQKLGNIHARDDLKIIPEIDGEVCFKELHRLEPEYLKAFVELGEVWPGKRQEVEGILISGILSKVKYKTKSIPGWLAAMDRLGVMTEPPVKLFKEFVKFTTTAILGAVKKGQTPPAASFFDLCENFYKTNREIIAALDGYSKFLEAKFYNYVKQELKSRKERAGIHSFDDLLTDLHQALQGQGGSELAGLLNRRYRVAMIDEFQDTDPVQYEIFSRIFKTPGSLLYLIGDPKQAIYSFRGADIFAYIRAVREVGSRYTLGENWRSAPGLVAAVNTIFKGNARPFIFDEIVFDPVRAADKPHKYLMIDDAPADQFQLWAFQRNASLAATGKLYNKSEATHLVLAHQTSEVVRLLNLAGEGRAMVGGRTLKAGDLAVLVRTNREARLVQESLADAGVASAINSSESLYASREAVELRIVLQAMVDDGDSRRARAALATRLLGVDGGLLDLFASEDQLLLEWLGKFRGYHELWAGRGFAAMFGAFLEEEDVRSRLLLLSGGERSLTNVLHLLETLHLAAEERDLGMAGLVKYLSERIAAIAEQPAEEQQLRLESDADLVQIVTIHKAKGLEYPVVFCPFCWEGNRHANPRNKKKSFLFHDSGRQGELILDIGSPDFDGNRLHAIREEMAENLRLLYVALTRAVQCCYLAWGPFNEAGTSALAYLLHSGFQKGSLGEPGQFDYLHNLSDGDIATDLKLLVGRSAGNISLDFVEEISAAELLGKTGEKDGLVCRKFSGSPRMNWRISSFSALSRKLTIPHLPGRENEEDDNGLGTDLTFTDIMDFPRGAGPGSFLHSILEDLDFEVNDRAGLSAFLEERLVAGGYDRSWVPALSGMIGSLLKTPLDPDHPELVLAKVAKTARLNELEFYFPLADFNPFGLDELLTDWSISGWPRDKIRGFMKGYIDLVFCHDEKFYIVDWKSNHLGKDLHEYRPAQLRKVMARDHYCLQYLIYTVALHRYLLLRMPGYSYEENFGGVFYIFLRGLGHDDGPDTGVFRDKPPFSLVRDLSKLFGG
ncbi:MAG: exodeoxyribonuclease V subunit beta [Thermodesulfobacteriota bacterium]